MDSSPPSPSPSRPRVVVVGAGLAGLAAAEALVASPASPHVTVMEAAGRHGGVLGTVRDGGWLVERSADCFLAARPEGLDLVRRLGLEHELVGVDPRARRALIWHEGRTVAAPTGFRLMAPGRVAGILHTPLLSPAGRLRVLAERFLPPRRPTTSDDDESLEHFAVRRLGREAFERLVQPLAAGIWTADPARLSMAAACPEFLAMERERGSLSAGERARLAAQAGIPEASGARYGQFVTLASGMETLVTRLVDHLRDRGVRFARGTVTSIARDATGWRIDADGLDAEARSADAVVVTAPSSAAAALLRGLDPALAADLGGIEYAGSCIVCLGFARDDVDHPLDAAGMVVPRIAGRRMLAASFSSTKFPHRAPEGSVLMRVFVGGALDAAAMNLDDDALVALVRREVADLLGARGTPQFVRVERWNRAMPQYHVGHVARVARIDAAVRRHPGLAVAGAAYTGVGIPQVIASGRQAAETCLATANPRGA